MLRFVYYVISVGQYFLHGFFEYFLMIKQKDPTDPALLGRYQFDIIDRIWTVIARAIDLPVNSVERYDPRSGVFTTFWGAGFIDFGSFIILYGFVVGAIVDYFRVQVQRGDLFAFPLYVLLIVQVFMSPWINGFAMAAASYVNLGLFGIWAASRWATGPLWSCISPRFSTS